MRFLVAGVAVLLASACQRRLAHDGLLLGLTSGRTIFIAWPNDSARLVTEKPHLLVPRDDGMWWVGVVSRCTIGEGGLGWVEDSVFLYRDDAVFVTRAGEDARVTLDGTTCEEAEKELLGREPARADSSGGEYFSVEQLYCGLDMARVTFVSPSVLSVERRDRGTEFCSPAKYSTSGENIVRRFESSERVVLRPLLTPESTRQLEQLFSDTEGCGFASENPGATVDSTWAIRRQHATWAAFTWVDGPMVCRGGYETEEGPALPSSFTGDAALPIAWSELLKAFPNAIDAAASPSGEYLVVQRGDSLVLVRGSGRQLGQTVIRVHLGYSEEFAMIRWTTPDETRRWIASLPAMQPPTVHVTPGRSRPSEQ